MSTVSVLNVSDIGCEPSITLSEPESAILRVLEQHAGRVVTRTALARRAGLRDVQPRRVDALLVNVRRFVGPQRLCNVRNRGWMLHSLHSDSQG